MPTFTRFRQSSLATAVLLAVCAVGALAWSLFLLPCAFAQSESASVSGRVTDQDNLVMPNVEVEIKNADTGLSYTTKTNGDGFYSFPILTPGNYLMNVHRLQFRSVSVTGIVLHVQDSVSRNFVLQVGSADVSITVTADSLNVNTTDASVSTVVDRQFVESLPLNGRSFNTLLQLTPGVVIASNGGAVTSPGQFSIGGQRTSANNFTIDGASANFGVVANDAPGASGTGSAQAFSILGGTSSLVSVEALQEFRIETSSFAPEFGRSPGGQVILTTRSGTNDFHGGVYEYFRNDVMDANNWFSDAATPSIAKAPERHNDFGGFLGGPIWKNKTFFFLSYEGARLRLPQTALDQVPSVAARANVPTAIAPYLNAYPIPNGPVSADGFTTQFTGAFSNSATLNAGSIRIDHTFNNRFSVFARYNDAPSELAQRNNSPNDLNLLQATTRTLTLGFNAFLSSRMSNTFRANYSTQYASSTDSLDSFGGAVPPPSNLLLGSLSSQDNLAFVDFFGVGAYLNGPTARNSTKQLNFIDDLSLVVGTHQLKYGVDYRVLDLDTAPAQHTAAYISLGVQDFISSNGQVYLSPSTSNPAQLRSQSLSLYAQDSWKVSRRATLTYGIRWELAPAPAALGTTTLASWTNVNNPSEIALAPPGTAVWHTTYGNFAPRIGLAYALTDAGDFVLRAGGGLFYDLGVGGAASLVSYFPNVVTGNLNVVQLPVADLTPFLPVISTAPPYGTVQAFAPNLKSPVSYQWNIALEKSFAGKQVVSATYVGQAGRSLLRQTALFAPNPNITSDFLVTENDARSNYNALQVQYRRPLAARLQALLNYTWSHSLDNASDDEVVGLSNTVVSAASDYASSSFDVRNSFSGALIYSIPAAAKSGPLSVLTKDWSLNSVIVARSGFPFNAVVQNYSVDPGGEAITRPDLVSGQPIWIQNPTAPGGRALNPLAFSIPATPRQGTEGRNDIPGFGLTQVDLSLARKFSFSERLQLQFRADAFNVFNHPNFTNPQATLEYPSSLQSNKTLNEGLGGLNPLFQEGGPRSLQLSLKLTF